MWQARVVGLAGMTLCMALSGCTLSRPQYQEFAGRVGDPAFATFLYEQGAIAPELAVALAERCRAGVGVNVLLDAVGSRNHRRILVVDGRIGFTGGTGIGSHWMGDGRRAGYWRQTDVRVEGPVVRFLQAAFAENWRERHPALG